MSLSSYSHKRQLRRKRSKVSISRACYFNRWMGPNERRTHSLRWNTAWPIRNGG
jgi:hypothetical protein